MAQADTVIQKIQSIGTINAKLITKLDDKYKSLSSTIDKQTAKALKSFQKRESRLNQKLTLIDSTKAKQIFGSSTNVYNNLQGKIKTANNKLHTLGSYIPKLDSLQTAGNFLQQAGDKLSQFSPDQLNKFGSLNTSLAQLQTKINIADEVKKFMQEREGYLKTELSKYNVNDQLKGINQEVYYYQQQINDYKTIFQDEQKLEQKALMFVREMPAFKDFMSKYSQLAQLFPAPQNLGTSQALAGLQTNSAVTQQLQQQLGSSVGGVNLQALIQQQMQSAQTQVNQLKDKVNQMGGGSSDIVMPDFKPNNQKTKSFLKRIEYGLNIQSQKTNILLPTTTDFALTVGYKLTDKATIGIGTSYKLGWGKPINEISLTNQGVGLRTYVDIKLKGSIWITGGYEQNWLPQLASALDTISIAHTSAWGKGWQSSGLIGITKKYKIGKKTSNMQLLWDFLSYQQVPKSPEIKFRIGYQL
jgi:hypothetical protein